MLEFFLLTIVVGLWALVKLYGYSFGKYSEYIYVDSWVWILFLVGIWVPILSIGVLIYILFVCKSVGSLMEEREEFIEDFTAEDIVENTDYYIINNNLTDDKWVKKIWRKRSSAEWVDYFSLEPELLKEALDQELELNARNGEALASWNEVVKSYIYLKEQR